MSTNARVLQMRCNGFTLISHTWKLVSSPKNASEHPPSRLDHSDYFPTTIRPLLTEISFFVLSVRTYVALSFSFLSDDLLVDQRLEHSEIRVIRCNLGDIDICVEDGTDVQGRTAIFTDIHRVHF